VAEDSVQEFFTRMMEKNYLAGVDRAKGKFRSFLLAAMKNFLANEWDKQQAQKRGSGKAVISLDGLDAEARYALEPADGLTPERLFDRRWALAVLDQVLVRLRQEYSAAGKQKLYESLKDCLTGGSGTLSHAEIGRALGLTEGAAKVAAHRIRKRYRELLRDEIAQTVASPDEVESEITYLLNCL
jgi:RNA polymerase sigma-70 factor (ECF subfamily)